MFPESLLINLIHLIYEAAADPKQWPVFLKHYAEAVGSPAVTFIAHDFKNQGATIAASLGFDAAWVRAYEDYYAGRNVWVQRGGHLLRPGVVACGAEMAPDLELVKSEFYNDFLLPQGHFYTFGGTVLQDNSATSYLTAMRSKPGGPFGEREFVLLRHLLPHLKTGIRLHQRVSLAEAQLGNVRRILDHFPQGVFIVDGTGRVLMMNQEADRILSAADGLMLGIDGLRTARRPETNRLRGLIAGAVKTTDGSGIDHGGVMLVSRRNGLAPLRVLVSPSTPSNGPVRGHSSAIVFVTEMERTRIPKPALLEQLLGFTPAEARLAAALLAGKTVQEFAEEAGVTLNTARTHLKRVFSKAGVGRQAELIRQLTAIASYPKP
jgi:DNA-binding CsgD family transcriptional regulator